MLKNYFLIAWRNLIKSRFYALLNIAGLATGICFSFLIGAYVWSEFQVNAHLREINHQYIIQSKWRDETMGRELTSVGPLAKALKENYPHLVANYFRWDGVKTIISTGQKSFREAVAICDSTLLTMYGFNLLHGNASTALDAPFQVVITAGLAHKYFSKTDVVGQTLSLQNFSGTKHDFLITGVLAKQGRNSITSVASINESLENEVFISTSNQLYFGRNMDWSNPFIISYIELQKEVSPQELVQPMQYLLTQHAPAPIATNLSPYLVSLGEYSLQANNGVVKKMLLALSAICCFILLMALINFVNLSISHSSARMREIGIRKVLGGVKRQIIWQFLTESSLLVALATLLAILGYELSRDVMGSILGKPLPELSDFPAYFVGFPILLILVLGVLSGIYPAFILSSLKAVEVLKGKVTSIKENILLRKSLVAFQFGTAMVVGICAIIIAKQINLFFSETLGYGTDYILSAQLPRNWTPEGVRKMENIRSQFAALPEVSHVTLSYEVPDGNHSGSVAIYRVGADSTTAIACLLLMSDEYYGSTYDIAMVAGEFYSAPGAFTDSSKVVINETGAKALGWQNSFEAVGKQIRFTDGGPPAVIAGVTKDFHFGSMQKAIEPILFIHVGVTNTYRYLTFKLKPGNISQTLTTLQKKWAALMLASPFEYTFMDDTLAKVYRTELQLKKAAYLATLLAFMIVLLGVLGLVSLSIQKRTKEIGIRKVLGASVVDIIALFTKEFIAITLVAALLACPLAYLLMRQWLSGYVYQVELTIMPFLATLALLSAVILLVISLQSSKAALDNPVKSLRSE
ncbi:FtsX-like permease family protein [Rhodocytophaga rosea]|uniref:FtsX-like permease family protein n=1 Tax=Rhodocytophaga rosea TaxID=2704465 RepID=A0A6C0GHA4_9BACT|nr:ABC transporter permease [Rhodocytophaga rosea]QHT67378.1 FtsX-like permease family protein [Rhodocytophaga rosea]